MPNAKVSLFIEAATPTGTNLWATEKVIDFVIGYGEVTDGERLALYFRKLRSFCDANFRQYMPEIIKREYGKVYCIHIEHFRFIGFFGQSYRDFICLDYLPGLFRQEDAEKRQTHECDIPPHRPDKGKQIMDKKPLRTLKDKIAYAHKRDDEFSKTPEGRALDNRMLVSRNIIALLKYRKLTQSEFCETIGMKLAQFNRIVMGDENITVLTATRIADGFGVHISRLYQKPRKRSEAVTAK